MSEPSHLTETRRGPAPPTMCVCMSVDNVLQPNLTAIPCNRRFLRFVLCSDTRPGHVTQNTSLRQVLSRENCPTGHVRVQQICLLLLWIPSKSAHGNVCQQFTAQVLMETETKHLADILYLISLPVIMWRRGAFQTVHTERHVSHDVFEYNSISDTTHGFLLCQSDKRTLSSSNHLFRCKEGGYISLFFYCDGNTNCPNDTSDETRCECSLHHAQCNQDEPGHSGNTCLKHHYVSVDGKCHTFNSALLKDNEPSQLGQPKVFQDKISNSTVVFHGQFGIPCGQAEETFLVSQICIFQLSSQGNFSPCTNGAHLTVCRTFQCNMLFKCDYSYCVPWKDVCNGQWDCPFGEDEHESSCEVTVGCKHMYKCETSSKICIHLGQVCDEIQDCPAGDDELLCSLSTKVCPKWCKCLLFAVYCGNTPLIELSDDMKHFQSITIENSTLSSILCAQHFDSIVMKLINNKIQSLKQMVFPVDILVLILDKNCIKSIGKMDFSFLRQLKILSLKINCIKLVENESFGKLYHMFVLDLSKNPLGYIPEHFCKESVHLQMLSLLQTPVHQIHSMAFRNMRAVVISTDRSQVCCMVPSPHSCLSSEVPHISCSDLLPTYSMSLSYLSVALLLKLSNTLSFLLHVLCLKCQKAFGSMVAFINVTSIFIALYLLLIWFVNHQFTDRFFSEEKRWRSSFLCSLLFFFFLVYSLLFPVSLLVLSVSRHMIVIHPIKTRFKRSAFVKKLILLLFCVFLAFSATVCCGLLLNIDSIPSKLCLPVLDPSKSVPSMSVLSFVVMLHQSTCFLLIFSSHLFVMLKMRGTSGESQVRTAAVSALVRQLTCLTTCCLVSWVPPDVVFVSAIWLPATHMDQTVIWMVVFTVPFSSLSHPLLFVCLIVKKMTRVSNTCLSRFGQ